MGSCGRRLLACSSPRRARPPGGAVRVCGSGIPQLGNAWCSGEHFLRTFLAPGARNEAGLPWRRLREFDTAEPAAAPLGKSVGDSSETPSQSFGVCPCHNAGFTADPEQWDGPRPSSGRRKFRRVLLFNSYKARQYLERGVCPVKATKNPG